MKRSTIYLIIAASFACIDADIRFDSKAENGFQVIQDSKAMKRGKSLPRNKGPNPETEPNVFRYRVPSTFGYAALQKQKKNKNDQFLRSNIDNQANKRNTKKEAPRDMLPCRQEEVNMEPMIWSRGEEIQLPVRWNNPHDSSCELNIWVQGMTKVAPIKRPFRCGGGMKDQRYVGKIPVDFPGCESPEDGCFLQLYGHSVETRTYATCVNFILKSNPAPRPVNDVMYAGRLPHEPKILSRKDLYRVDPNVIPKDDLNPLSGGDKVPPGQEDIPVTKFQKAVHYWDSFDTSHIDSSYSGYRGQQKDFVRDEVMAAIELRSYIGNGGLLKDVESKELRNKRESMRKKVDKAIKAAEKKAKKANRMRQRLMDRAAGGKGKGGCFESRLYSNVLNARCKREYKNTYVTNVGYRLLMQKFLPLFKAEGLTPYTPTLKNVIGRTPKDGKSMKGSTRRNRRKHLTPQKRRNRRKARNAVYSKSKENPRSYAFPSV